MSYTFEELVELINAQSSSPWLSEKWRIIDATKDINVLLNALSQTEKLRREARRRLPLVWIGNRIAAIIWTGVMVASITSPFALLIGREGDPSWISIAIGYCFMLLLLYLFVSHPKIKELAERLKDREDSQRNSAASFRLLKRMIEIRIAELRRTA